MSGVLHPVGPQPARTYWVRRGVVVVVAVVVVVLLVNLVRAIASPAAPTTAAPAGASPGPAVTRTPAAASSPSAAPSVTLSPTPTPTTTPKASPTRPTGCTSADLTTKIRSRSSAKAGKPVAFALGVVNRSDQTCVITIGPGNVELKIYSGTDRIWSTKDCATLVRHQVQKAAAGQGLALMVTWNGRRSAAGCKTRPEIPKPGTYFATFRLHGADPVQQRVIISS